MDRQPLELPQRFRLPANQADATKPTLMAWHQRCPREQERIVDIIATDGCAAMLYTAPIWIEPYCMQCHSNSESAPASTRRYGNQPFDDRLGDPRSVPSIKMQISAPHSQAEARWRGEWLEKAGIQLIPLFGIGLLLNRLVLARLEKLRNTADEPALSALPIPSIQHWYYKGTASKRTA